MDTKQWQNVGRPSSDLQTQTLKGIKELYQNQSMDQSIGQSINPSINNLNNQSLNQSINQTIFPPIHPINT